LPICIGYPSDTERQDTDGRGESDARSNRTQAAEPVGPAGGPPSGDDEMSRLSVPLALEDFVPVLLSAVGFAFIVRLILRHDKASGRWAALGVVLIVAGGLSRAAWKLLFASGGPDLAPLHAGLYPLLAIGFPLLALSIWTARRTDDADPRHLRIWAPVAVLGTVLVAVTFFAGAGAGRLVPLVWLAAATVGSASVSLLLFRWARAAGLPRIGWLFVANLAITIALNGLARPADQTEALQWVQQGLNTVNQALFLIAARSLSRRSRELEPSVDVTVASQPA
jgi:hypothetical protein